MKKIYLCGGINGLSDAQCNDWREEAKLTLGSRFEFLDPMRRDYRGREHDSVNEIVQGDLDDIQECDVVLANASRASWGTAMELVYARQFGKPVYAFTGGARVSPWLRYHSTRVSEALICAVNAILRDEL